MSPRLSRVSRCSLRLCLLLCFLAPSLIGCRAVRTVAAKYPAPDIEQIYLPHAQPTAEAGTEHNPVVVIPGFGGSELRDASGG